MYLFSYCTVSFLFLSSGFLVFLLFISCMNNYVIMIDNTIRLELNLDEKRNWIQLSSVEHVVRPCVKLFDLWSSFCLNDP